QLVDPEYTDKPILARKDAAMAKAEEQNKFNNRRKAGRVRCDLTTCQFGTVLNISRTGMKVLSRKMIPTMPPGASTNVTVTAAGRSMSVPARSVHNRPRADGMFEVGFQFVGITEAAAKNLVELARTAFDASLMYNFKATG